MHIAEILSYTHKHTMPCHGHLPEALSMQVRVTAPAVPGLISIAPCTQQV